MNRTLFLLSFVIVLAGCENPYSKYYTDLTGGKSVLDNPNVILPTEKPTLIRGSNPDIDDKAMMEDGYLPLGFSIFNAGDINHNDALKHAKKIHACTVVTYCEYTNTVSGIAPMTVPTTQTSYHSGSVYGSGGFANYSGTSTTYGSTTSYIPYSYNRYDYYASYWIKAKTIRLGIHWNDLTEELRKKAGSNKGVYITAIVKGSPAFNGDLISGDVIRRFNEQEIIDRKHFQKLLDEVSNPAVELEIFRDGKTIKKQVQLHLTTQIQADHQPTEKLNPENGYGSGLAKNFDR
jgi:hypothetical protein